MPERSEAAIQKAIIAALTLLLGNGARGWVERTNAGSVSRRMRGAKPGTPDLQVCLSRGRTCRIEVKRLGGKLSPAQNAWNERAVRLGHNVAIVDSVDQAINFVREVEGMR